MSDKISNEQLIKVFFDFQETIEKVEKMLSELQKKSDNISQVLRDRVITVVANIIRLDNQEINIAYSHKYSDVSKNILNDNDFRQKVIIAFNSKEKVIFPDESEDYGFNIGYFDESGNVVNLFTMPLSCLNDSRLTREKNIIIVRNGDLVN